MCIHDGKRAQGRNKSMHRQPQGAAGDRLKPLRGNVAGQNVSVMASDNSKTFVIYSSSDVPVETAAAATALLGLSPARNLSRNFWVLSSGRSRLAL